MDRARAHGRALCAVALALAPLGCVSSHPGVDAAIPVDASRTDFDAAPVVDASHADAGADPLSDGGSCLPDETGLIDLVAGYDVSTLTVASRDVHDCWAGAEYTLQLGTPTRPDALVVTMFFPFRLAAITDPIVDVDARALLTIDGAATYDGTFHVDRADPWTAAAPQGSTMGTLGIDTPTGSIGGHVRIGYCDFGFCL